MLTQRGHNLIELMLTLVISCILLKLIFNIFMGTNTAAQAISEIHTIQRNASTLIATLTTEIKQSDKLTINNNTLTVTYAEFPVEKITEFGRTTITATAKKHFHRDDLLVLADYRHREIIKADKVYRLHDCQRITLTKSPLHQYTPGAEVSRLVVNKYFVKQSSLYLQDIKGQRSELIDGVSQFSINFADKGVMADVTFNTPHLQKTWHFFIASRIHLFNRSNLPKSDRVN